MTPTPPLRVLLEQRILPPYRVRFYQALAALPDFRFTFACGPSAPHLAIESLLDTPGLEVRRLTNYFGVVKKTEILCLQAGLLRLIDPSQFDAMIAEYNPRILTNWLALAKAKRKRIPFLWWGHGFGAESTPLTRRIRLWLTHYADGVILYHHPQADRLVACGIPREKIFVAPNSLDTEAIEGFAIPYRPAERPLVLYIGRLIPEKKVDLLIRGFALALSHLPPSTRLAIVGDGPEAASLRDLALGLNLADRIEFAGAIYDEQTLSPWFNAAWISVSPGGVGLSAIHSLCYGIPMAVAKDEGHGPERAALIEGETARFFDSDQPEALADCLLELHRDPKKLMAMSAKGRAIASQYGLQPMVEAFRRALVVTVSSLARRERPSPDRASGTFSS